jgi:4-hydroxy-tetrahydrodipicolinate synthase
MAPKSDRQQWAAEHMVGIENQLMPSFTPDMESLDEAGIRWDVRRTIEHGFFSTLCTAEAGMSFEEAKEFVGIVADEAGDDLEVSTTLVFDSFEQIFGMLDHAETVGADAAMIGYPLNWYPDSEEAIYERTREMCEATDLSIVLYVTDKFNFERFHPANFPLRYLDDLADIDNVVGVKISDPALVAPIDRICGDRLLLSNPIEGLAPTHVDAFDMQWMGAGPYEVYQTPEQPLLVDYFDDLVAGEWDAAMETYHRLTPIRETFMQHMQPQLRVGTYHWPEHKYYQWLTGGNGGYTRQPVMSLPAHEREGIKSAMRRVGLQIREADEAEFFAGRVNHEDADEGDGAAA